jgi:hypothetical protein
MRVEELANPESRHDQARPVRKAHGGRSENDRTLTAVATGISRHLLRNYVLMQALGLALAGCASSRPRPIQEKYVGPDRLELPEWEWPHDATNAVSDR